MSDRNYRAEIAAAHAVVWQYRARLADKWPCPATVRDSLAFALCEACEAVDAALRNNPLYVRNNHRNLSVTDELADCAMMLLTALGRDYREFPVDAAYLTQRQDDALDVLALKAAQALYFAGSDTYLTRAYSMAALALIAAYPGMPPMAEAVTARLDRIAAKVGG